MPGFFLLVASGGITTSASTAEAQLHFPLGHQCIDRVTQSLPQTFAAIGDSLLKLEENTSTSPWLKALKTATTFLGKKKVIFWRSATLAIFHMGPKALPHPHQTDVNVNCGIKCSHSVGTNNQVLKAHTCSVIHIIVCWVWMMSVLSANSFHCTGLLCTHGVCIRFFHRPFSALFAMIWTWKCQSQSLWLQDHINIRGQKNGKSSKHIFAQTVQSCSCFFSRNVHQFVKEFVVVIYVAWRWFFGFSFRRLFGFGSFGILCLPFRLLRPFRPFGVLFCVVWLRLWLLWAARPWTLGLGRRWPFGLRLPARPGPLPLAPLQVAGRAARRVNQDFKGRHHWAELILKTRTFWNMEMDEHGWTFNGSRSVISLWETLRDFERLWN